MKGRKNWPARFTTGVMNGEIKRKIRGVGLGRKNGRGAGKIRLRQNPPAPKPYP